MMKNKKIFFITIGIIIILIICATIPLIFFKDNLKEGHENNNTKPNEEIVIPDAPSENTESLIQNVEKIKVKTVNNNVIEFPKEVQVETGEKVAVWIYSKPKFLGYFEVVNENGVKMIKGLEKAMKDLEMDPGEHNLAIVSEEGESIGYIDVYVEENKLFEDEKAAVVSKYTTKEITEEIEVKYQTETKKDANKKKGSKEVIQQGVNGISEITYKITYDENGNEISKEKVSEKVIKEAVKEIIVTGTSDYNVNSAKITSTLTGFMCTESQTMVYDNQKVCNDFEPLSMFNAIGINKSIYYVISIDEKSITPIKITKTGSLYKGTYKGTTYYFESRGGGTENITLTLELCKQYNLNCGAW